MSLDKPSISNFCTYYRTQLEQSLFYTNFDSAAQNHAYVIFRAILDLSNRIALLILLRMFALYVKKKDKN